MESKHGLTNWYLNNENYIFIQPWQVSSVQWCLDSNANSYLNAKRVDFALKQTKQIIQFKIFNNKY